MPQHVEGAHTFQNLPMIKISHSLCRWKYPNILFLLGQYV